MYLKVIGIIVLAAAAAIGSIDCVPKSPMRLKDLDTPEAELASHGDVWKLIMLGQV